MYKRIRFLALLSIPFLVLETASQSTFAENIQIKETLAVETVKDLKVSTTESIKANESLPVTVGDLKVSTKASDLSINSKIVSLQPTSPQTLVAEGDQPATADSSSPSSTEPSFGSSFTIMPSVGTLGFGLAVATPINSNFQARVGLNYAGFGINSTTNDIKYDGNLNLFSATALVDYYPFGLNSFLSITGGLAYQDNRLSGKAVPNGGTTKVTVNNVPYDVPNDSSINGTFSFPNSIAPYIGIGFATQIAGGFGIYSNLGVIFAGTPKADITATGSITNDPVFKSNLEAEKKKAQDEVNKNVPGIYPVLTFGLSYQF